MLLFIVNLKICFFFQTLFFRNRGCPLVLVLGVFAWVAFGGVLQPVNTFVFLLLNTKMRSSPAYLRIFLTFYWKYVGSYISILI